MKEETSVESWQVREFQRQNIIKELIGKSYQQESKLDDELFHIELVSIIAQYLKSRRKKIANPSININGPGYFFVTALKAIEKFARTKEEEDAMVAQFLEKVLTIALALFHATLAKQEMFEPKKIFDAPSALSKASLKQNP